MHHSSEGRHDQRRAAEWGMIYGEWNGLQRIVMQIAIPVPFIHGSYRK